MCVILERERETVYLEGETPTGAAHAAFRPGFFKLLARVTSAFKNHGFCHHEFVKYVARRTSEIEALDLFR